jgi:hypothetical protein
MQQLLKISAFLILLLMASSCLEKKGENKSVLVAFNNKLLMQEEVQSILPEGVSQVDSARMVNDYVESWVKHQLVLQKAKLNVDNLKEVESLVQQYEDRLLIEHYLLNLIERKAEITPTEDQIAKFYDDNVGGFKLSENLFKGIFVILPVGATNQKEFEQQLRAEEIDREALDAYCLQNAAKIDFMTENWTDFRRIKAHFPSLGKTEKRVLKEHGYYKVEDSVFQYIIRVDDYLLEGDTAPMSYIREELEEYLLNSNKATYLKKMEKDLYEDALQRGLIGRY